jgi:hypothetical protein
MRTGYDMSGRILDTEHPDISSGYYLYSDETISEMAASGELNCPDNMRPGFVKIKGIGKIPTCGGRIYQENLPDVYVVDWRYRQYVQLILIALALTMLVAVGLRIFNR